MLEPGLAQLGDEYRGRVLVAKFEMMKPYFAVTSEELRQRYNVSAFPTVILFVNGRDVRRWEMQYDLDEYRRAIDEVLKK